MTGEMREKYFYVANEKNMFSKVNNISLTDFTDEYAVAEHEITKASLNPFGVVHGGLIATMIDFAGGALARTDGRRYVTSSMEVKFISNASEGKIIARSELINRGRTLCNIRVRATAKDSGKLIAEGTATFFCVEN